MRRAVKRRVWNAEKRDEMQAVAGFAAPQTVRAESGKE
jgi:hypothetical protein